MVQTLTRRSKKRKLEILRAAARTFRRKGYDGAAMADIAADLEMTKGSLYYYFRNKQDLLSFCQRTSLDRLLAGAREIVRRRLAPAEKLRELIRLQVRCLLDDVYGAGLHLEVDRRLVAKRDEYERILRRVIAEAARRGVDPKLAGLAVLGAVNWSARWYDPDAGASPDQIADAFADVLVEGVR